MKLRVNAPQANTFSLQGFRFGASRGVWVENRTPGLGRKPRSLSMGMHPSSGSSIGVSETPVGIGGRRDPS